MLYDGLGFEDESVYAQITSLCPTLEENKLLYSFTVNATSGIYYKYLDDEKQTEAHLLTSDSARYEGLTVCENGRIVGKVLSDGYASNICFFAAEGNDYQRVTGGDSLDENPYYVNDGEIWFNSYGVCRDQYNEFVRYAPSEILKLDLNQMQIQTILAEPNASFVKPVLSEKYLYCIKMPLEKEEKFTILDILLVPVRIVQAIWGFLSAFVRLFAKKPLIGKKGRSSNGASAAKNAQPKQFSLHNRLLNVDEELKKNKNTDELGFIPRSWKLMRYQRVGDEVDKSSGEELASGVADFLLLNEGLIYVNGKKIFLLPLSGEKRQKLHTTDFCVKLGGVQSLLEKDVAADF